MLWQHLGLIYCKMHVIDRANWGLLGDYLSKKINSTKLLFQNPIRDHIRVVRWIIYSLSRGTFNGPNSFRCSLSILATDHIIWTFWSFWSTTVYRKKVRLCEKKQQHQQHARSCLWLNIEHWPLAENRVMCSSAHFPLTPTSQAQLGVRLQVSSARPIGSQNSESLYI